MVAVVAVRSPRALRLGRYWSSAAAVWTRLVASCEMRISTERPLRMYDAVVTETPALTATSDNVDLRRLDNAPLPAPGGTNRRHPLETEGVGHVSVRLLDTPPNRTQ